MGVDFIKKFFLNQQKLHLEILFARNLYIQEYFCIYFSNLILDGKFLNKSIINVYIEINII